MKSNSKQSSTNQSTMKQRRQSSLPLILVMILALFAASLTGCVSMGENFDENQVSQIKKGQTTEADLIDMFGQPQNRGVNSEGMRVLTWQYMESRVKGESFIPYAGPFIGGSRSKQKTLTAQLGPDGKVASFESSAGGMETRSNQVQDVPKK